MRENTTSSTLTVYFDGQFWVGMAEHVEDGALSACGIVFGPELSDEEVYEFVLERWHLLEFGGRIAADVPRKLDNPKRRQRAAARELAQRGASTRAQLAVAQERESQAAERMAAARADRKKRRRDEFDLRTKKRKRRHRGK